MNQPDKTKPGTAAGFDRDIAKILARDPRNLPGRSSLHQETMLINEISLVLAEKRTFLSVMRTGLAVLALPLSVLSVLIVISRYYDPGQVMYLLGPLLGICAGLTLLGFYLVFSAFRRIQALNPVIAALKSQKGRLREQGLEGRGKPAGKPGGGVEP